MKKTIKFSGIAVAMMALIVGCEPVQSVDPVPNSNASNLSANFLFVNASPDATALNFYVNNVLDNAAPKALGEFEPYTVGTITTNLGSNTRLNVKASSGTIGGPVGSSDLIFRSTNTGVGNFGALNGAYYTVIVLDSVNRPKPIRTVDASGFAGDTYYSSVSSFTAPSKLNASVDTTIQLNVGSSNSIVTYNLVAKYADGTHPNTLIKIGTVPLGSSDPGGPRFLVITDYLPAPATSPVWPVPASGKFAARFINASADAGAATCKINSITVASGLTTYPFLNSNFNPSVGSRTVVATSATTGAFANNVSTTGSYTANVTVGANTYMSPTVAFADGGVYTVILSGSKLKGTLTVTVVTNK